MAPKFRCWFKDTGTQAAHMVEWHELREFKALGDLLQYSGENKSFHLMQSTGLKDKNGVEIFEGDIVRWYDVVTWDYSVTFKDGVFCISDDPSSNFYHLKEDINGKFEVIGNIYENPELLEQANEN